MPPCKNDASRRYSGKEPSPKGLGMCAHAEKAWVVKKGVNGKKWYVSVSKTGVKSWKTYKSHIKTLRWDFGNKNLGPLRWKGARDVPVHKVEVRVLLDDDPATGAPPTGHLLAYHNSSSYIYDDVGWSKDFLKHFSKATKVKLMWEDLSFSEAGLQGRNYGHMDVSSRAVALLLDAK